MKIHVGIPCLNRYDLLQRCMMTLQRGSLKPTDMWIIDNGGLLSQEEYRENVDEFGITQHYWRPPQGNVGVAASWNWIIKMTGDYRVICNDDIIFNPDTLERLIAGFNPDAILCPENIIAGNSFSCFIMPDNIVRHVGYFDETISPNYAYYEDGDMSHRVRLAGYKVSYVSGCLVDHSVSSTLQAYTPEQLSAHHAKFELAKSNYQSKWGGLPGSETYSTPFNRGN